jgi:hypothetical protein
MRHIIEILHDSAKAIVARNTLAAEIRDLRAEARTSGSADFQRWARRTLMQRCQNAPKNQHPTRLLDRAASLYRIANALDRAPAEHLPCGLQDARSYEIENLRRVARECSRLAAYLRHWR